jgi:hypothetical protein
MAPGEVDVMHDRLGRASSGGVCRGAVQCAASEREGARKREGEGGWPAQEGVTGCMSAPGAAHCGRGLNEVAVSAAVRSCFQLRTR